MFTIRRATVDDAQLLAHLLEPVHRIHAEARPELFKPHSATGEILDVFRHVLSDADNYIFIAETDGQTVGYVYAQVERRPENPYTYAMDFVHVEQISVNDDQRGKGCGQQLMNTVYDLARKLGISRVTLGVWAFNTQARRFYEKQGFTDFVHRMEIMLE